MRIFKLIIWICIILGIGFGWKYYSYSNQEITIEKTIYEVTDGETFSQILIQETQSPLFTKVYLKNHTPDFSLQKGRYNLEGIYTLESFIDAFEKPINEDEQITILEGWNIYDIDEKLAEKGLIKEGDFINYVTTGNFEQYHFLKDLDSLEGYLYPDTYNINPNTFSVEKLVSQILGNFNTRVYQAFFTHADNETIFENITLASIVEKEERNPSEKATVAGILKKRLDENWMIGADITVCYAFALTSEQCKLSVTKYLYEKNDYNTRQKTGLPAGPISNPSVSSIEAVLYPKETDYYYYLHDTQTGQIYYGRTEAEHNRNKNLYLR